jgi:AraC-like DNA-binding protein
MSSITTFAENGFRIQHCISNTANRPHAHRDYTVAYTFSGRSRTRIGLSTILSFGPREVNLLNPGEVHEDLSCRANREYLMLSLKQTFFQDIVRELSVEGRAQPSFPMFKIKADRQMQRLCETVRYEIDHNEWGREIILRSAITELAIELIRRYCGLTFHPEVCGPGYMKVPPQMQRAIEYMNDNYSKPFNLSETAASAGLSKYYFDRVFKKAFGTTPHSYFLSLRLERAKEILASSGTMRKPLAEIALELGFSDQSHFTTAFRNYSGLTPRKFRQHAT